MFSQQSLGNSLVIPCLSIRLTLLYFLATTLSDTSFTHISVFTGLFAGTFLCVCACVASVLQTQRKKKYKKGANLDRLPSRNIETLSVLTEMDLGKPRLKRGRNMKGNRKGCYEYISRIKNAKENLSDMLVEAEELLTTNTEKAQLLKFHLHLFFPDKVYPQVSQKNKRISLVGGNEVVLTVEEEWILLMFFVAACNAGCFVLKYLLCLDFAKHSTKSTPSCWLHFVCCFMSHLTVIQELLFYAKISATCW